MPKLPEVTDAEILEAELIVLIRKLWALNAYAPGRIDQIVRGLKYEEMASLPAPCDRH